MIEAGFVATTTNSQGRLTARLILVRHGPSSHVHDGRWLTHRAVHEFEDAYDVAGIRDDSAPPADLVERAREADSVIASDLPRAVASAERLAKGRHVVTSALLREIRLEPPRWVPFALPIGVWDMFSHLQWSYRLFAGTDHPFVRRAEEAGEWLVQQSRTSGAIIVVTHGGFRRLLAARLILRGWRWHSTSAGSQYANWSSWELANHG